MLPLLVPFGLGVLAVLAYRRLRTREAITVAGAAIAPAGPSPLSVLAYCMRQGAQPTPFVVRCAIAEAQAAGDFDLARRLRATFAHALAADAGAAREASPAVSSRGATARALRVPNAPQSPAVPPGVLDIGSVVGPSPLEGVSGADWSGFVQAIEREPVTFATDRQVGAFRHRCDRLRELGIDPAQLATRRAQIDALAKDMADAHRHARDGGLLDEFLATTVAIDGKEHPITLSGILGVVQCAGLDGACEWLCKPEDRTRFPHTTKQFLQTNGVF